MTPPRSKPRKVVGPVELPQQLVTFLHELAQMLAQIEYMEMEVSNTLYFILFYFFLIEAINRMTIYKKKKKKKKEEEEERKKKSKETKTESL
jgi:large-conductance mechanosensitive channel